jgi:AraC-like DNA-binding protein
VQPNRRDNDAAAGHPPDRHYSLGTRGFVHTSQGMVAPPSARPYAVVLLSACGRPFHLHTAGHDLEVTAAVVGPQVLRSLRATDVALVSFHIAPSHRAFPAFAHAFAEDVRVLRRERFTPWDAALRDAVDGEAALADVSKLFDEVAGVVHLDHCHGEVHDPEMIHLLYWMDAHLDSPIDALARQARLTPAALTRRFQESLGLPLRAYQAWLRTVHAWPLFAAGKTLTDIAYQAGYSDSSHLSRSWRQIYGVSPSYMRSRAVQVIR